MVRCSFKKCSYVLVLGMLMPVHVHAWLPSPAAFCSAIAHAAGKIYRPLAPYAAQGVSIVAQNSGKVAFAFAALSLTVGYVFGSRRQRSIPIAKRNNALTASVRELEGCRNASAARIVSLDKEAGELKAEDKRQLSMIEQLSEQLKVALEEKDRLTKLFNKNTKSISRLRNDMQRIAQESDSWRGASDSWRGACEDSYRLERENRGEIADLKLQMEQAVRVNNDLKAELHEREKAFGIVLKNQTADLTAENKGLQDALAQAHAEIEKLAKLTEKNDQLLAQLSQQLKIKEAEINVVYSVADETINEAKRGFKAKMDESAAELNRVRAAAAASEAREAKLADKVNTLKGIYGDAVSLSSEREELCKALEGEKNQAQEDLREMAERAERGAAQRLELERTAQDRAELVDRLQKEVEMREQKLSSALRFGAQLEATYKRDFDEQEVRNLQLISLLQQEKQKRKTQKRNFSEALARLTAANQAAVVIPACTCLNESPAAASCTVAQPLRARSSSDPIGSRTAYSGMSGGARYKALETIDANRRLSRDVENMFG